MPNHVTNILKVHGDEDKVRAMFETIKSDEIGIGSIDLCRQQKCDHACQRKAEPDKGSI
ncbi:hypothetical protein [Candidatus Galacturonibacter soehngenii]|uniref:hypothetical protein n=1 Tax=Candidatus Galacturonatibacter soehngenii TaxID=2307010 RepID=UPI001785AF29|nr:hypothetical protein [Candidatus Galacturonibacter soehngenii]